MASLSSTAKVAAPSGHANGASTTESSTQNTVIKDRIVYLNDALSGLHGSKLRNIAQDIYRSRKVIYDSQRRKWMDTQLQTYLESKIPEYLRIKYQNTFGMYDGIHFPSEHTKSPDIWSEKSAKKGTSMSAAFSALRLLNRKLASNEKESKRIFEEEANLGKRCNFFDFQ
jgi:hypothetical protein